MVKYDFVKKAEIAFGLCEGSLTGRSRRAHIVVVRHALHNIFRRELGFTFEQIGMIMKRNHATIMHSIKVHNSGWVDYDNTFEKMYRLFENQINYSKRNIAKYSIDDCENEISRLTQLICTSKEQLNRLRRRRNALNSYL